MGHRILVVRLSSLGDVILTAPVYRALKSAWPDCRISALVKPQFADALRGNPMIDEVIPFEGLGPALKTLRAGGFTHLLDLHANLRSFLIRRAAGIPNVSVYKKNALARRIFVALRVPSPALERHTVERYLDALAPWGIARGSSAVRLNDIGARRAPGARGTNVLLIQTAFLGDTLLTLPLAARLKKALPGSRLTVLTLENMAELFRKAPEVDEVLVDRKRGGDAGLRGTWRLAGRLRERGFDLAVIPHRSFRSALLAYWAGVPRRIGFATSAGRFLLTDAVPFAWMMHDLERNLSLLRAVEPGATVEAEDSRYVTISAEERASIDERLGADGVPPSQRLIGVHPGAAWSTKRWLPERYAELCRRFAAEGFRCVLVGGPADKALCAEIAASSGALDWAGRTDLTQLKALMARLSLFATNDSGPMHLAAAAGVPVLAFFGPTSRELGFFPYGEKTRVLEHDLACRPCGLHGGKSCPEGHFLCMKLTTVDLAWKAAQELLATRIPA